ncbi:hypothetical protein BGW38_002536 [Lunasporangiospora selenospora]|uniref:Uncharacterized protein n=1 Tax=Lunasporangiospora selenospora TaxID=979761 RepID=A0A9P6KIA5_9FUNG|nr:hypothetical protein BGW38_002536 [Lunasporangiospora selenospora]
MATLVSQTPITLRNPFTILASSNFEEQNCIDNVASGLVSTCSHPQLVPTAHRLQTQDGDVLDLSTWCVITSADSSDEDEDENEDEEILKPSSSDLLGLDAEGTSLLTPLTLSTLSDGFTHISRTVTANSINSSSASAPEHRGAWVLRVSKRRNASSERPVRTGFASSETPACESHIESSTLNLQDAPTDPESGFERIDGSMYMSMTEHELAKSTKAVKIKNTRVAVQHDRDLAKALGCIAENSERPDKKVTRAKSSKGRRKCRNKTVELQ